MERCKPCCHWQCTTSLIGLTDDVRRCCCTFQCIHQQPRDPASRQCHKREGCAQYSRVASQEFIQPSPLSCAQCTLHRGMIPSCYVVQAKGFGLASISADEGLTIVKLLNKGDITATFSSLLVRRMTGVM